MSPVYRQNHTMRRKTSARQGSPRRKASGRRGGERETKRRVIDRQRARADMRRGGVLLEGGGLQRCEENNDEEGSNQLRSKTLWGRGGEQAKTKKKSRRRKQQLVRDAEYVREKATACACVQASLLGGTPPKKRRKFYRIYRSLRLLSTEAKQLPLFTFSVLSS